MCVAGKHGGGHRAMKIYFLLMIVSVFVALSYIPIRTEVAQRIGKRSA
jgi:hypothetical protein